MTPAEYLDACKQALTVESDYALAQKLELRRQLISKYRNGENIPDDYACARIAMTLGLDWKNVRADILSQSEKDPKRAAFWRDFLSGVSRPQKLARTLAVLLTAACLAFASAATGPGTGFFRRRISA